MGSADLDAAQPRSAGRDALSCRGSGVVARTPRSDLARAPSGHGPGLDTASRWVLSAATPSRANRQLNSQLWMLEHRGIWDREASEP